MSEKVDYKQLFIDKVEREYKEFINQIGEGCRTQAEVKQRVHELCIKMDFLDRLTELESTEEEYKRWLKKDMNILHGLYERYRNDTQAMESEDFYQGVAIEEFFKEMDREKSYKELALEKLKAEYEGILKEILAKDTTPEEVFNNAYENYVKMELYFTFMNHEIEFSESLYYALSQEEGKILHGMFEYYSEGETGELNSSRGCMQFIENYCDKYYSDIMEEFECSSLEGMEQG